MSCRRIQKLLPLAAGGDADRAENELVDRHVTECLPCYRDLAKFRTALEPLRRMKQNGGVPRDLLCDVLDAVEAARARGVGGPVEVGATSISRSTFGSKLRFAAAAAVVFLAVFVGSEFNDRSPSSPSTRAPSIAPFDQLIGTRSVTYPLRRDVFGGASPVLLPAVATSPNGYPTDDYYPRFRRSQPTPAVIRVTAQADDF